MERMPSSERAHEKLKALMVGRSKAEDGRSELVRLAARLIIEEALEGEARDALGRDYYAHGAVLGVGYCNGYRTGRVESAEAAIEYSTPQIADRSEPFRSRIRELVRGRTEGAGGAGGGDVRARAVDARYRGAVCRPVGPQAAEPHRGQ
jgi:putative transposase